MVKIELTQEQLTDIFNQQNKELGLPPVEDMIAQLIRTQMLIHPDETLKKIIEFNKKFSKSTENETPKEELTEMDKSKASKYVAQTCHDLIKDIIMDDYAKDKLNAKESK